MLISNDKVPVGPFDVTTAARIERAALSELDFIATIDYENGGFQVNLMHPLLKAVQDRMGGSSKAAREAMRALDLFAVSERLFEGFLQDMGMPDEQIIRIVRWRDGLLRAMALRYGAAPTEEVVSGVLEASYQGAKPFEDALAKLFNLMGFETSRDGIPRRKDVLVVAPIGVEEYRFTVEAKGSINPVENDDAEIGDAAAHREQVTGAELAIVVAREFAGFKRQHSEKPMALQTCEATGGVSIVTVDVLAELLDAVRTYHYPLEAILPVLQVVESPAEKLERVRSLSHPTDGFDFRGVLEKLWELQQKDARGDMVAYRQLWQSGPDRWGSKLEDFEHQLRALEALSGYLLQVLDEDKSVVMRQNPEMVASCIQQAVESQKNSD